MWKIKTKTRLLSSRMRSARTLTVSPSMLCGRGVSAPGGSSPGGVCSWGGGIPACTEADPPCEQNHTRLWKHNLAQTSLRAVIKLKLRLCRLSGRQLKILLIFRIHLNSYHTSRMLWLYKQVTAKWHFHSSWIVLSHVCKIYWSW